MEEGGGKKVEAEELLRNWAELPHDVLSVIFKKIGAIEILLHTQFVCRPWRHLSFDPAMWRVIDMTTLHGDNMELDLEAMAKEAVDRSQGQLEVFWLEYFGSDDLLRHIADRTSILKCLRLISAYGISDKGLSEMVSRLPQLEELDITFGSFTEKLCGDVGKACPHLKCFRCNAQGNRYARYESDAEALGIAGSMPELRRLQLVGNKLTNKGLTEILDKCIHLEYLDLRCCFYVNLNLDTDLRAKCARIRELRFPNDPTDDYEFVAECDWDGNFYDDDNFYSSGYSDIEMMIEDMYFHYSDVSEDEDAFDFY